MALIVLRVDRYHGFAASQRIRGVIAVVAAVPVARVREAGDLVGKMLVRAWARPRVSALVVIIGHGVAARSLLGWGWKMAGENCVVCLFGCDGLLVVQLPGLC